VRTSRAVVDLRSNPGGENGSYPPLLAALQQVARERPGTLRLLVGRSTFSAATSFVMEVLATTDAVVVGEAMGGSPNLRGDADLHRLPSGPRVHVATRWWEMGGRDDRVTLEPLHVVWPGASDDPVSRRVRTHAVSARRRGAER
jgi:hypothetical protein